MKHIKGFFVKGNSIAHITLDRDTGEMLRMVTYPIHPKKQNTAILDAHCNHRRQFAKTGRKSIRTIK